MWDVDGNEYLDYHAGFAPYILGHNDPDVNAAVAASLANESSNFGSGPTRDEGVLARYFCNVRPSPIACSSSIPALKPPHKRFAWPVPGRDATTCC